MLTFQNTYTNADKLLEAAEQLAQTGECDPEEIYQAAHQLEDRIQDFVRRVEQRKVLLDMSVAFHTHVKEVCISSPLLFSSFTTVATCFELLLQFLSNGWHKQKLFCLCTIQELWSTLHICAKKLTKHLLFKSLL